MYLNEQLSTDKASYQKVFYFLFDELGGVLKAHGRYVDAELSSNLSKLKEALSEKLFRLSKSYLTSETDQFKTCLYVCVSHEVLLVNCFFTRKDDGHVEVLGYVNHLNKERTSVSIDKLPYPIAVVKKDGELVQLNKLFIEYFLDNEVVATPIFIQDIIKTNIHSPETFDYAKMIESDANSRAVFCQFKAEKFNQTFLLNLIPLSDDGDDLYLAAVRDLTHFIEVQQKLENQNEELRKQVSEEFEINKSYELKLLKKNRLESLGEIAFGLFHELNQPLTHLSLKIDNMLERYKAGKMSEEYLLKKTEQIQRQISRMRGMIDEMKQFSTVPDSSDELIDVKEVLNCALEDVSYIKVEGLILTVEHIDGVHVKGTSGELEQVFVNVLTNSLQSLQIKMRDAEGFKPKLKIAIEKNDGNVRIIFIDNGLGASKSSLKNLFNPFYTTKKDDGGTGLGLFIINNLMRKMMGSVELQSAEGKFFKVILLFPLRD